MFVMMVCVCVCCVCVWLFWPLYTAGNPQPTAQDPPQESLQASPKPGRDSVSPSPSPSPSPRPSRDLGSPAVPPRTSKNAESLPNSYLVPSSAVIADFHLPTPPGTPDMRGSIPVPVEGVEHLPTHPGAPLSGEQRVHSFLLCHICLVQSRQCPFSVLKNVLFVPYYVFSCCVLYKQDTVSIAALRGLESVYVVPCYMFLRLCPVWNNFLQATLLTKGGLTFTDSNWQHKRKKASVSFFLCCQLLWCNL